MSMSPDIPKPSVETTSAAAETRAARNCAGVVAAFELAIAISTAMVVNGVPYIGSPVSINAWVITVRIVVMTGG